MLYWNETLDKTRTQYIYIIDILEPIGSKGCKYIPVLLEHWRGFEHTLQELRQILTHNHKGLPIVFLYHFMDGPNTGPSSERGASKGSFRRPSHSEVFLHRVVL